MRIVVNHLTRMQPGYICVAGIDVQDNEHIRPVLGRERLTVGLLARNGGAFDMGRLVDLGPTQPSGTAPETEDHAFDPSRLVSVRELSPASFWKLLTAVSCDRLTDIFGNDLKAQGHGCTVDEGQGNASLGCLRTATPPSITINPGTRSEHRWRTEPSTLTCLLQISGCTRKTRRRHVRR